MHIRSLWLLFIKAVKLLLRIGQTLCRLVRGWPADIGRYETPQLAYQSSHDSGCAREAINNDLNMELLASIIRNQFQGPSVSKLIGNRVELTH
tara:strand:+ start:878 stop:1156 length:279 start_codon:yes stop_codon:yes gene_type:complete